MNRTCTFCKLYMYNLQIVHVQFGESYVYNLQIVHVQFGESYCTICKLYMYNSANRTVQFAECTYNLQNVRTIWGVLKSRKNRKKSPRPPKALNKARRVPAIRPIRRIVHISSANCSCTIRRIVHVQFGESYCTICKMYVQFGECQNWKLCKLCVYDSPNCTYDMQSCHTWQFSNCPFPKLYTYNSANRTAPQMGF